MNSRVMKVGLNTVGVATLIAVVYGVAYLINAALLFVVQVWIALTQWAVRQ